MKYLLVLLFSTLIVEYIYSQDCMFICSDTTTNEITGFINSFANRRECARCVLPDWDVNNKWALLQMIDTEDGTISFYYHISTLTYERNIKHYSVWIKTLHDELNFQNGIIRKLEYQDIYNYPEYRSTFYIFLSSRKSTYTDEDILSASYSSEEFKAVPSHNCNARSLFLALKKLFK